MLFVIGVLLIAVAAGLLLRAFMLSRVKTSAQLREIDTYGFNAAVVEAQPAAAPSPRSVLRGSVERNSSASSMQASASSSFIR